MTKIAKFVGLCTVSILGMILFLAYKLPLKSYAPLARRSYTYVDGDYPILWPLSLDQVHLTYENTVHYAFDTELGDAEWNTTLPSGGALLHLGSDFRPFTLGMFHEIRCLNIIRKTLVNYYTDKSENAHIQPGQERSARHCMNYLRQMVLCHASLRLESLRAAKGNHVTVWDVTHTCQDWAAVYDAAEKNYQDYLKVGLWGLIHHNMRKATY